MGGLARRVQQLGASRGPRAVPCGRTPAPPPHSLHRGPNPARQGAASRGRDWKELARRGGAAGAEGHFSRGNRLYQGSEAGA